MPQRSTPLTIDWPCLVLLRRPLHGYGSINACGAPARFLAMSGDSSSPCSMLISSAWRRRASGRKPSKCKSDRPARRLLAITAAGEAAFVRWLAQPVCAWLQSAA